MAASKRKTLSKKIRFEVFKRDNFTCQYCGRMAPDVILEVDHISPISSGGDNSIINLITSCFDCNRGKGKRKLTQNEEIKKQQEMLKQLNQKREQLEMMLKWKKELEMLDNEMVDKIEDILCEATNNCFSEVGRVRCLNNIKKFGFEEVYESTKISINQYLIKDDEESIAKVFDYIGKICYNRARQKDNPKLYHINYLIKIAENRLAYCNNTKLRAFFKQHFEEEDFDFLKEIFKEVRNWTELREELNNYYGEELR